MAKISFRITGGTDVGLERVNNEDNFILNADLTKDDWFIPSDVSKSISLGEYGCLLVVADGMGGMNAGEIASEIAIESVKEAFSTSDLKKITVSNNQIKNFLEKTVEKADLNIKNREKVDNSTSGMGTTIVIAWIIEDKAHICWCGDSRAYLFNSGSGMVRLSKDHSYVQQLVDEGKLDAELAFDHPNSNIITRSLGDVQATAQPDYVCRNITEGDMILLCSDGLCGLCRDEEIMNVLAGNTEDIDKCKSELIAMALEAGGYDNVTIAIFQTLSVESETPGIVSETFSDFKRRKSVLSAIFSKKNILIFLLLIIVAVAVCFYIDRADPVLIETIKSTVKEIFKNIKVS